MSNAINGGFTLSCTLGEAVAQAGNVLTGYTVPVSLNFSQQYTFGTGANQVQKIATAGGNANAAPASIDLTTIVCVDGTVGFATALRELAISNDSTTAGQELVIDMTVANAFLGEVTTGGITAKISIPPGAVFRFSNPLDIAAMAVGAGNKVINLNPGANNIPYRLIAAGW